MHGPREPQYVVPGILQGLLQLGNIDLSSRPVVHNPNGSYSTVDSTSWKVPGRGEVLMPQVVGGRVVDARAALAHFLKTGQNLGTFASPAAANRYAKRLHNEQAIAYAAAGGR